MTDRGLLIVAATVMGEAENQGPEGMLAVAWVIKNRTIARRQHPIEVCLGAHQFSFWNTGTIHRARVLRDSGEYFDRARAAVIEAWYGHPSDDPTQGADHYHRIDISVLPAWAAEMTPTVEIGDHVFYDSRRRR